MSGRGALSTMPAGECQARPRIAAKFRPARHERAEQLVQRVLGFADQGEIQEGIILQPLLFQHREVDAEGRYFDLRQGILDRLGDRHVAVNRREAGVDDDQVGLLLPDVAEHIVERQILDVPVDQADRTAPLGNGRQGSQGNGGPSGCPGRCFLHAPPFANELLLGPKRWIQKISIHILNDLPRWYRPPRREGRTTL